MTTYNYDIGQKICEWHSQRRHPSHWEAWSGRMIAYHGKQKIVFQFVEYGLTAEASRKWDSIQTEDDHEERETFVEECAYGEHTDYGNVVDRDFIVIPIAVWKAFERDYDLVIDDIMWDEDLSLRKLPRKMTYKNTTTIGEQQ